ncbi:YcaO-like family protein [Thalassotalea fusca]
MNQLNNILERLVAPNFGLLTYVSEVQLQPVEPDVYIAVAEYQDPKLVSSHTRHMNMGVNDNRQASGAGLDRESALWSTVGEAVERYAASVVDVENLYYASFNELEGEKLDPRDMILFADWQYQLPNFRFHKFCPDKPFGWTKGYNLTKQCDAHLPARFAYLDYVSKYEHEAIDNGYSTGLAAGPTMEAAICSGIREVIERDAFSCYFLNQISPPKIDIDGHLAVMPEKLQKVLKQQHIDYYVSDITTEFNVPCVMSVLKSGTKLGFSTGTSCHMQAGRALEKAVVESFHTFNWILDINRWQEPIEQPEQVRSFADHVSYYLDGSRHQDLAFLTNLAPASQFEIKPQDFEGDGFASKDELNHLVDLLAAHGYEVFVVDLTTEDISSLGFHVIKVIIPGLQPLYAGYGNQHLDPRRLTKFANNMGYQVPESFNQTLHAFP